MTDEQKLEEFIPTKSTLYVVTWHLSQYGCYRRQYIDKDKAEKFVQTLEDAASVLKFNFPKSPKITEEEIDT